MTKYRTKYPLQVETQTKIKAPTQKPAKNEPMKSIQKWMSTQLKKSYRA